MPTRSPTVPLENLETFESMGVSLPTSFQPMIIFLTTLLATLWSIFRSRASLGLEKLALRHQIVGEGRAGVTSDSPARNGIRRSATPRRRTAPPRRPTGCLNEPESTLPVIAFR